MRKYYSIFTRSVLITLVFISQTLAQTSQTVVPKPFHKCWEANIEGINRTQIASDNAGRIYFSYSDGHLSAVSTQDGEQLWKTELGGRIVEIDYDEDTLFTVSVNNTSESASEQKATVRAVSTATGVVKWQQAVDSKQNSNSSKYSIIPNGKYVFFIAPSGVLYKLSKDDGQSAENINLGSHVTTDAYLANHKIYVGTGSKDLCVYSVSDGVFKKVPLTEAPTSLYAEDSRVIIGDALGKLVALTTKEEKKDWQTRTGAEVANITKTDKGLAVSSNDNFVYLISPDNGGRIWKRRLAGRTTSNISRDGSTLYVVSLNAETSTLVETEKGKTINQISIQNPKFFISKPAIVGNMVIFPTNTGLIAYSATPQNCVLRKEDKKEGKKATE